MPWYVFALVDTPPHGGGRRGFSSPLAFKRLPGCFAAAERRDDVPPVELAPLQQHDRVVAAIWKQVPAILPVRFGTLLDIEALRESLADREEGMAEAFDLVRNAAQFTWRRLVPARSRSVRRAAVVGSGADYLRRAAARSSAVPTQYASVRAALAPFVRHERFEAAALPRPERLYHLVGRRDVKAYEAAADTITPDLPLAFSGPWPPYAFAPGIL